MRRVLLAAILIACTACKKTAPAESYLFVWAGDLTGTASDFLAVIDANPSSPQYGSVITSLPTGEAGTHPHHTEAEMPANGHLLANGFQAGRTWLFDLTSPRQPKILTVFGDVAGFSHPHTFVRTGNGNLLATFQYTADSTTPAVEHRHEGAAPGAIANATVGSMAAQMPMPAYVEHVTGGIVEMDERGTVIRRGSASDASISDKRLYPYSVLPMPNIDRAVSTTTDMDHADTVATAQWVQFWRLSDLTLLKSIALQPGPRGDENRLTGEPHLLPDGKSVYIHTFMCGLYLVRGVASATPTSTFVKAFEGDGCGVPILTGHWWLQPVPAQHAIVALDITDAEHPRQVASLTLGDETPHWIAMDPTGKRIVLNSGGGKKSNRLYVINFDSATGALSLDEKFRDAGSASVGVNMSGKTWPHGFTGSAVPHGTVFSRP